MPEREDEVLLYAAAWSPECRIARRFLERHKVPFRWIDIEADSPRQAALKALKIQRDRNSMATVFEVNGERIDLSETKDVAPG